MTKITGISEGNQLPPRKITAQTRDDLFKNTLDHALKSKSGSETAAPLKNGNLGEIQAAPINVIEDITHDFQDDTNRLIDLLESYAEDLGNPDLTLKQIEPKVSALKENAEKLMAKVNDMPQDDAVRKIATQTALAANVEYIKFYRGDYI